MNTLIEVDTNNNNNGIQVAYSSKNTITGCECNNNDRYGIILYSSSYDENKVNVSSFTNNDHVNAHDSSVNAVFDLNYYSDYAGADSDGNGIGDTPHPIAGFADNEDLNPLMVSVEAAALQQGLSNNMVSTWRFNLIGLTLIASTIVVVVVQRRVLKFRRNR